MTGVQTCALPILTDYATALEISDWSGATGRNISGTSDLAPIEEQEAMLKELFPDVKQVGLLYCSAEANSLYQIQLFEAALDKDGIAYKEYAIADTNEVHSVTGTRGGFHPDGSRLGRPENLPPGVGDHTDRIVRRSRFVEGERCGFNGGIALVRRVVAAARGEQQQAQGERP